MTEHKFAVGQSVKLRSRMAMLPRGTEVFQVIQAVMLEDLPPQYRIVNGSGEVFRVVAEDELEEMKSAAH